MTSIFGRKRKEKSEEDRLAELPLEKLNEEYLNKGKWAWDMAWDILHRNSWKPCLGNSVSEEGIVYYQHWPDTGNIFRLEGLVEGSADLCFNICVKDMPLCYEWNPSTLEGTVVHVVNENTDISYNVTGDAAGGLVSKRDFVSVRHWKSRDGYTISAGCGVAHPKVPPTKKYVRGENKPGGWVFKEIPGEKDKCIFIWLLNTNIKGWLPQALVDKTVPTVLLEYLDCLRKRVLQLKAHEGS